MSDTTENPSCPEKACKPQEQAIPPLTNEHIYVITELAKIGLSALADIVKEGNIEKSLSAGAADESVRKHFETLATVAGPETVSHFDRICQFIFEQEKAAAESRQKEAPDAK